MAYEDDRPLSPHLQVYRLPLTAVLSITHRLSGLAIVLGAVLLIFVLFAVAAGPQVYATAHAILDSWLGRLVLVGFTLALYFHLCNGVRHLFWDMGYGFELETVDKTALGTVLGAVVLTAATWLLAWL
jgi:succinate dehydrogenase / fumarate reductase cytochrome b subunit